MIKSGAGIQSFQACAVNCYILLLLGMRKRAYSARVTLSGIFKVWGKMEVDVVYLFVHSVAVE